jgi:hypothetical protein
MTYHPSRLSHPPRFSLSSFAHNHWYCGLRLALLFCFAWNAAYSSLTAQQAIKLTEGLTFLAGFDGSADASFSLGDAKVYHAKSLNLKDPVAGLPTDVVQLSTDGKYGGCLKFGKRSEVFTFYRGEKNVAYNAEAMSGTVSLWMKLDPQKDLEPGFVDPLQITDKAWNDSCLFLDFTKDETPRHFRLGVFSDYKYWNPQDTPWDNIAVADRPMIVMEKPTFSAERWTHVAFVWRNFNTQKSSAELYLDGTSIGTFDKPQRITWDPSKLAVIPGIYYSGWMDELAIWSRALSAAEIQALNSEPAGLNAQIKRK